MTKSNIQKSEAAHQPLLATAYLRALWSDDFERFRDSESAPALLERLRTWAAKQAQKETTAAGTFVDVFFKQTWGYRASGQGEAHLGFSLDTEHLVKNAGQGGGPGSADIALGHFGRKDREGVPQVLGEFKDDRSGLDKPQNRANPRTPVEQCFDYLREARAGIVSKVLPTWALVTDMNEFRLYISGKPGQYQRFVISPKTGDPAVALTDDTEEAAFQRYLFSRIFHADMLLADYGKSPLEKLLGEQLVHERVLEADFYKEYHSYREHLFAALSNANPHFAEEGRARQLVSLTQRLLDRFIFVLYCEDMGQELGFPPHIVQALLKEVSESRFYSEEGSQAWDQLRSLFAAMRDGGSFGAYPIHRFNGGLFAPDPELDNLRIPNFVFCARNQGSSPSLLLASPKTLLFLSAKYNFGATDDGGGRTLTLTVMGRIFEQSITDLEVMQARAAGRESLTEITKRKRDGVYYTPEWVTKYIVEQTVGERLAEIRTELGFDRIGIITEEQIRANQRDGRKAPLVKEYEGALHRYTGRLDDLKVVDPACGSGAFLIQAFQFLYAQRQWVATELERVTGTLGLFDDHGTMRSVLVNNLYGVDINPESVEITRLALWLHTALPGRPLTSLDENIRCGNSLVATDFLEQLGRKEDEMSRGDFERVNCFDWEAAFPEVFERETPGFDCVIGNPPYVKLQNFRRVLEDQAEYLLNAKKADGSPRYESTQDGNFDLYLPFIERGMELLSESGKLGYIAPNVWLKNSYGAGLRGAIARQRSLRRWVDFEDYQVFREATTYTAIQIFSKEPTEQIEVHAASDGDLAKAASCCWQVGWPGQCEQAWVLLRPGHAALFKRLRANNSHLGDEEHTAAIYQGLKTSGDSLYIGRGMGGSGFMFKGADGAPLDVELESDLLRPVISGAEAKRYCSPSSKRSIIVPYLVGADAAVSTVTEKDLAGLPLTAAYLRSRMGEFKSRERGRLEEDQAWWRFIYPKNLALMSQPKLMIAGTAPELRVQADPTGEFAFMGGRVYGIAPSEPRDIYFLCGVLNSSLLSFLFRQIARPKAGGAFDIETQFLAPLPIPRLDDLKKQKVADAARLLEALHTTRSLLAAKLNRRLTSKQCEDDKREESWLWCEVESRADLQAAAPTELGKRDKARWAKAKRELLLTQELAGLDTMLQAGATLEVQCEEDELRLLINGRIAIEVFSLPDETEAKFVAAQWRQALRGLNVTASFDGKRLLRKLLSLRRTGNPPIVQKVIALDSEILALDDEIDAAEKEMNTLIYSLYGLTEDEIRLVEAG